MVMCATKKNKTRKGSRVGQSSKYAHQEALQRRKNFESRPKEGEGKNYMIIRKSIIGKEPARMRTLRQGHTCM